VLGVMVDKVLKPEDVEDSRKLGVAGERQVESDFPTP